MSEFTEWAKRFEGRETQEYREGRTVTVLVPPQCMFALREGHHKRACLKDALFRREGVPVCERHRRCGPKRSWRGFVEGA